MSHLTWPSPATSLFHSPSDESKIMFKVSNSTSKTTKKNKQSAYRWSRMKSLFDSTSDGSKFLYALKWQKEIEEISVKKGLSYIDIMHGENPFYLYILEKVHRKIIIISTYYSGKYKKKRKCKKKTEMKKQTAACSGDAINPTSDKSHAQRIPHSQPAASFSPPFLLPPSLPSSILSLLS